MKTVSSFFGNHSWWYVKTDERDFSSSYFCKNIEYHEPKGEGDRHYVDAYHIDGSIHRVFDLDEVVFKEEGSNENRTGY